MRLRITFLIFFIVLFFMAACSSTSNYLSSEAPMLTLIPAPTPQATPETGKSTLIGRLVSNKTNAPLTNTFVRLAEVVRQGGEGAYVLDIAFSPGATSNDAGIFVFNNIQAKEYVMVVGDVYDKYEVIPGDDGKAKVWEATPDKVIDFGDIYVETLP